MKKIIYLLCSFSILVCTKLKAQDNFELIKNNKVPGLLYAPTTTTNVVKDKGFEGSSLAKAMKEGKLEGDKYSFSTNAPATSNQVGGVSPKKGLSSEMSESEAKAIRDKEAKQTQASQPVLPTQEVKKE
ncbi:hypothetical protein [Emticicia sp. 17c]|uniref:hypothetical protein n=1 Tax=Emticicia sp. 17c TaxID=3127704 RepID=UPI00301C4B38